MGWVEATITLDRSDVKGFFLTVHTPSNADVSPINPLPYPAEAPWIASAAQKWITCESIPMCADGALTFTWTFSLVNSYADAIIHGFEGGVEKPSLIASSPPISFIQATAPTRGHLARLPNPTIMLVTWWSPSPYGTVRWGDSSSSLTQTSPPALAATYSPSDLCGPPATAYGWQEAHFWLSANISGLVPGSSRPVFYTFGDAANGWSEPVPFYPPPLPADTTRILLLADNGVTEPDGCVDHWNEPNASLTVDHLRTLINTDADYWSLVIHAGDVSYATGLLAKWATFTARWQGVFDRVPYFVGQGNHERDFPNSGNDPEYADSMDSGGECGVVTETIFPGSIRWRALAHGSVHVIMLNSELVVAKGSPQLIWLEETLAAVDRAATPWSIVVFHRPIYAVGVGGTGGTRDPHFAPLEAVLVAQKVDVVFVGHVHNALVTCAINNSTCQPGAPVHICIGNAGQTVTPIQPTVPEWVDFQEAAWGFSTLEANSTHMSVKLFADVGGLWYAVNFTK